MRVRTVRLALLTGLLALPVAAMTAEGETPHQRPDFTRMTDAELSKAYTSAAERRESDWCGFMLPLYSQMENRGSFNPNIKYFRALTEMQCALTEQRWTDAYQKLKYVQSQGGIDLGELAFVDIAGLAGDRAAASAHLLAFLETPEAGGQEEVLARSTGQLLRSYRTAKDFDGALTLMRALQDPQRIGKFNEDVQISFRSDLFAAEVEAGNFERAREQVEGVGSADSVVAALGDRRFEPLWPQLEAKAGPHLHKLLDAELARAIARQKAEPDNLRAFQELATSYLRNARFEDVIALVDTRQPDDFAGLSEDMGWALNAKVYALDALGRHDEAADIFDRIVEQPYDPAQSGWMVNFAINRGSRFVDLGQYEKGLEAADYAGRIADRSGSDYARMLVRYDKICALTALGRAEEAKAVMAEVEDHLDESVTVAASALLCGGAEERAAEIVRRELGDQYGAMSMATALQRPEFDFYYIHSVRPSLAQRIRPRPDVAPIFEKVARDIPLEFATPFGMRREELAGAAMP